MRYRPFITIIMLLVFCSVLSPAVFAGEDLEVRRISKEDARKLIEDSGVKVIDVRYVKNYEKSDMKIEGAVREDPNDIDAWVDKYPRDKTIILYCD
jgi:rhodanese-related sulfurtransferase